jgi:hypothetical protein
VAACNIGSEFQIEHNAAVGLIRFGVGEAYLALGSACRAALFAIGIAVAVSNAWNGALAGADCAPRGRTSTSSTQYRVDLSPPDYLNAESVKPSISFVPSTEIAMMTDKSKMECSTRLAEFVGKLDELLSTQRSVTPIQQLFKEYFPLEGCDPDEVVKVSKKSRYFSDLTTRPTIFVILFDSRIHDPHSGISVQFSLDRLSGNSRLPFVVVKT